LLLIPSSSSAAGGKQQNAEDFGLMRQSEIFGESWACRFREARGTYDPSEDRILCRRQRGALK